MLRKAVGIISILTLCLLAVPLAAHAQQAGKVWRIGFLSTTGYDTDPHQCPTKGTPNWQALVAGLRERGYVQGQNLVITCRWIEGREERAPALAAELVSLKPDLLVAVSTANVRAAKQATSTIPIVMTMVINPVERGLVASLARPGGNVTGLTGAPIEMEGKRLQLLQEAVPMVARVAVLGYVTGEGPSSGFSGEIKAAGRALGLTLQDYGVRVPEEIGGAFTAMVKARAEALYVSNHPFWFAHSPRIVEFAAQNRLPAMYYDSTFVRAGGLIAYDVSRPDIFRGVGLYVDKILKGAKPGDLPVEQPTKFELIINLKTAKALGITIPPSMLMRADEVIE